MGSAINAAEAAAAVAAAAAAAGAMCMPIYSTLRAEPPPYHDRNLVCDATSIIFYKKNAV